MQGPKMITSPIAMLPPELIRGIISFAVGYPSEHHTTLQLSQVSHSFRQTVLDMSWLFTEAYWQHWSTPLLDLWCQRARAQPITFFLTSWSIHRLTDGKAPELKALLESHSWHWGTLMFEIYSERPDVTERCIRFMERLLQCACPLLHTIEGSVYDSIYSMTLPLQPDCFPSLQTLHLDNIWSVFSTSSTSVTELEHSYSCPGHWSPLLDALKGCPLIQKLTIRLHGCYGMHPITSFDASDKVVLPSLTLLEFMGLTVDRVPTVSDLLSYCDIPKLESLNIWYSGPWLFKSLCRDLVSVLILFLLPRAISDWVTGTSPSQYNISHIPRRSFPDSRSYMETLCVANTTS